MSFLVKSGRAMLYPIYKSTYERAEAPGVDVGTAPTAFYRDHVIQWSKDLGRSLDYIESRKDLDAGKIALYGLSWGARLGPLLGAATPNKRHVLTESGHIPPSDVVIHEALDWLDRYLGPVQ